MSTQVLDVREAEGFGGAHVPGSIDIYEKGVPTFAGWFLSYERPLLAVPASDETEGLARMLLRMGFGRLQGYLAGGLHSWYSRGLPTGQIDCVTVEEARRRHEAEADGWVLDVRSPEELEADGEIPGAANIPIREVSSRLDDIPRDRAITIFCGSGRRSMIVASILKARGWKRLTVVLGGVQGWIGAGMPLGEA